MSPNIASKESENHKGKTVESLGNTGVSTVLTLVLQRRFELRTPCLKGRNKLSNINGLRISDNKKDNFSVSFAHKIVKFLRCFNASGLAYMSVDISSCGDAGVTQQLLRVLICDACFIEYGCESVPKLMSGYLMAYCVAISYPSLAVLYFCK